MKYNFILLSLSILLLLNLVSAVDISASNDGVTIVSEIQKDSGGGGGIDNITFNGVSSYIPKFDYVFPNNKLVASSLSQGVNTQQYPNLVTSDGGFVVKGTTHILNGSLTFEDISAQQLANITVTNQGMFITAFGSTITTNTDYLDLSSMTGAASLPIIDSNLTPDYDGFFNIGTPSSKWNSGHFANNLTANCISLLYGVFCGNITTSSGGVSGNVTLENINATGFSNINQKAFLKVTHGYGDGYTGEFQLIDFSGIMFNQSWTFYKLDPGNNYNLITNQYIAPVNGYYKCTVKTRVVDSGASYPYAGSPGESYAIGCDNFDIIGIDWDGNKPIYSDSPNTMWGDTVYVSSGGRNGMININYIYATKGQRIGMFGYSDAGIWVSDSSMVIELVSSD